jgi:hypothetical protein
LRIILMKSSTKRRKLGLAMQEEGAN